MLSIAHYEPTYVDACRVKVERQIAAYEETTSAAKEADTSRLDAAIGTFEPLFFNHMVLALDHYFGHRSRTMELKDGNPLNEVRVLCNAIMHHDGVMTADKQIKMKPATSILRHDVGDKIELTVADFRLLSEAFFAEIENKYL